MRQKLIFLIVVALLTSFSSVAQKSNKHLNIIFDTDIGPDYDDVGAIAMVHAFADSGKVKILATMASSKYPAVAQVLDVYNTYFRRPDLPIGVPKGEAVTDKDFQNWSDTVVARYPHSIKSNNEAADAVEVYRKILASQPDKSVTMITVGFLTNLSNLLATKGDKYSKLSGEELVKKKVKILYSMAGKFPSGREYNIYKDIKAAKKVFESWPTEIIMSGWEIGEKMKTGLPLVNNKNIRNSPVKDAFRISIPQAEEDKDGRMSWDQSAVFVALEGISPYYELKPGRITLEEDGSNQWDETKEGHFYLVARTPEKVTNMINDLMMHKPMKGK